MVSQIFFLIWRSTLNQHFYCMSHCRLARRSTSFFSYSELTANKHGVGYERIWTKKKSSDSEKLYNQLFIQDPFEFQFCEYHQMKFRKKKMEMRLAFREGNSEKSKFWFKTSQLLSLFFVNTKIVDQYKIRSVVTTIMNYQISCRNYTLQ